MSVYSTTVAAEAALVHYWRFGESSGTSCADSKGSNALTASGGYTRGVVGLIGADANFGIAFGGVDGTAVGAGPTYGTAFSGEILWKRAGAPNGSGDKTYHALLGNGMGDSNYPRVLVKDSDGSVLYQFRDSGGTVRSHSQTSINCADGNPHHIIATHNGTVSALYVDGAARGTPQTFSLHAGSTGGVRTGRDPSGAGVYQANGTVDELAIYTAALSSSAALTHYQAWMETTGTAAITRPAHRTVAGAGRAGVGATGAITRPAHRAVAGAGRAGVGISGAIVRPAHRTVAGSGRSRVEASASIVRPSHRSVAGVVREHSADGGHFRHLDTPLYLDTGLSLDDGRYFPFSPGLWFAWGGLPFDPSGYDDCTGLLISATYQRGGTPEITGAAAPGQATFVIRNPLGIFNPDNTASPLYGLLTDGVPVWFGANLDGTLVETDAPMAGRFAGRITDISPVPVGGAGSSTPTVEIICEDALGWYGRTPVALSVASPGYGAAASMTQQQIRAALLTAAGEGAYASLDTEPQQVTAWLQAGTLLDLLSELNTSSGTRHFVRASGAMVGWYEYVTRNRNWKIGQAADVAIDPTDRMVAMDGYRITADGIVNRQTATVQSMTFPGPAAEVWAYDIQPGLPIVVRAGSPLSLRVSFSDYVSPSGILPSLSMTGDAATVDYQHHGATGDFTITSTGATAIVEWSLIGRIALRGPAISHTADNTASQTKPRGIRSGPDITGDLIGTFDAATALSEHIVWRYADREGHGGILRPQAQLANWLPDAFTVDLYDLAGLTSPQLTASGRVFEIVGVAESVDQAASNGVHWTDTLQLQEARVQPGDVVPGMTIFRLDFSVLDGPDVLGF